MAEKTRYDAVWEATRHAKLDVTQTEVYVAVARGDDLLQLESSEYPNLRDRYTKLLNAATFLNADSANEQKRAALIVAWNAYHPFAAPPSYEPVTIHRVPKTRTTLVAVLLLLAAAAVVWFGSRALHFRNQVLKADANCFQLQQKAYDLGKIKAYQEIEDAARGE